MNDELTKWALPRIERLLPLDTESLTEILTYTASLSKEAGAEHLKNLLGDSVQSFEFISAFNSRRSDIAPPERNSNTRNGTPQHTESESGAVSKRRSQKKTKAPLHNAGPVRQPEGYGNVAGGYQKAYISDDGPSSSHQRGPSGSSSLANSLSLSLEPAALLVPKVSQTSTTSAVTSRGASPSYAKPRLPPSAAGNLISDLPNVRSKQSKKPARAIHSGTSTPGGRATTTTTSSIADLTSAIAALEVATNPTLSTDRRKCDCNASLHPSFTTAPNCLICGKIICALEGLQPCSYCDSPILTRDQVTSMIRALKDERGTEKMATHNASQSSRAPSTPYDSSAASSADELTNPTSSAAARARAHRDKLLTFQRENAQRTRVHDEAADYDTSLTPGTTQWMSPMQRAAALKKQQAYMRELQEASRPEWERTRTVMSMSVRNGKLVRTYEKVAAPTIQTSGDTDVRDEDGTGTEAATGGTQNLSSSRGAFSNNPLLASGHLLRPVWRSKDSDPTSNDDAGKKGKDSETVPERKSVWRRVQDDNEDNERWLLDGGLRGYGVETRIMEDGSQQECG